MNLLEKISSYELPNMIIPGTLMCGLLCWVLNIEPTLIGSVSGIIIFLAASYVFGLFASRAGSVILEPIAKWFLGKKIKKAHYEDFCYAESQDTKVTILAQYRDLYRTMVVVGIYSLIILSLKATRSASSIIDALAWLSIGDIIVFFLAYKKQSTYVTKRVKFIKKTKKRKQNNEQHHIK